MKSYKRKSFYKYEIGCALIALVSSKSTQVASTHSFIVFVTAILLIRKQHRPVLLMDIVARGGDM